MVLALFYIVQTATDIDDGIGTNQEFFEPNKESYQGEIIDSASNFYIVQKATETNDVIGTDQESNKEPNKESYQGEFTDQEPH
jgi:hypothetical protein